MMTFDALSDLVDTFENAFDVPLARETADAYDGGVQVVSTWAEGRIERCAIVPKDAVIYDYQSEGYRKAGGQMLYLRSEYAPGAALYETRNPDVIEWQGALWKVESVKDWRPSADVIEATVVRLDRAETTVAQYIAAMTREAD